MSEIESVLIALRRVIHATDMHSKHLVKTTGLTAPQLLLLQIIRDKGELPIGAIANEMSLSQATVTTIIDRLEKRELVTRSRSQQDKRKVYAYLTNKAKGILQDAPIPLQTQLKERFSRLESWEQSMILASLQRIATMMDADQIDAAPILDFGITDEAAVLSDSQTSNSSVMMERSEIN